MAARSEFLDNIASYGSSGDTPAANLLDGAQFILGLIIILFLMFVMWRLSQN